MSLSSLPDQGELLQDLREQLSLNAAELKWTRKHLKAQADVWGVMTTGQAPEASEATFTRMQGLQEGNSSLRI